MMSAISEIFKFIEVMAITCTIYPAYSDAGFTELPSSVNATAGDEVVFRCQHSDAEFIGWRVNGMPFRQTTVPGVSQGADGSLIIRALPENNGTLVECLALFTDGTLPIPSPSAILIVQEKSETESEPTTASNGEMLTTESEPTTASSGDFIEVPSPPAVIVTLEERHVYMCNHSETERILWRVNGSLFNVEIFPPGIDLSIIPFPDGSRVSTLTIGGRPEHNVTTIQCLAQLEAGSTMSTLSVTLLIQGIPQNVNKLVRNGTSITWEAPFSLNLTNVEPDIAYCVEVFNITCGRSHLISDCKVMENKYSSGDLQAGYIYEYTVTPRSNVEGALNGTSVNIKDEFMRLELFPKSHTHPFKFIGNVDSDDYTSIKTRLHLNMGTQDEEQSSNKVRATSYSLLLNPIDGYEEGKSLLMSTTVSESENGNSVILEALLPFRRRLNYTILAYGCDEHPVMEATQLSTHDIQNMSINSPHPGEIRFSGDFINGSSATGVLAVIILSNSEVLYHFAQRGKSGLHVDDKITNVVGGDHVVSIFVVEENGIPLNRTASAPRVVSVMRGNTEVQSLPIEYDIQPNSHGVCINCTFLDNSTTATDCVAVVHQRISQLNSSGLMNIESSHKFTRSGDTASGCIEGVNLVEYQVGIIGGKPLLSIATTPPTGPPPLSCTTPTCYVVVGVVALLVLLLAVATMCIMMFLITYKRRIKQQTRMPSPESPLPKPPLIVNEYEIIAPASPTEATGDSVLLFRITSDGPSPQQSQEQSNDQCGSAPATPPPVPEKGADLTSGPHIHGRIEADSTTTVVYSETVATKLFTAPLPTAAENVVYHEVQRYQNSQGQHYTMISELTPRGDKPDDLHKTESAYSEIKHDNSGGQVVTAERAESSEDHSLQLRENPASPTPAPFTLEHLLPELMPHASKWQSLGEALSLDEDRLDEIFTNNETDEACLEEMLKLYLQRSDLNHSWDEIEAALEKIKKAENTSDYNSTFDEEAVQHPNERRGSDGGSFESGMGSKIIPDTTMVVDDRLCPVMDNNETTIPCTCVEIQQGTTNFTEICDHELHKNESHSVSDGGTVFGVLVLVKESRCWITKQFVVGRSEGTVTSAIVTGKNCSCRRSSKA